MEERRVFEHAAKVGEVFQTRLHGFATHPLVGETRGVGLIGGIELVENKQTKASFDTKRGVGAYCSARCEANGLIARNIGDTVAFCPPLVITAAQTHELFDKFAKSLDETLEWVNKK
jgi:4-aminobutyrate--pyruvate transaminase